MLFWVVRRFVCLRRMLIDIYFFLFRLPPRSTLTDTLFPHPTLVRSMAPSYPELDRQRSFVKEILAPEERRFDETLSRGLEMLEQAIEEATRSRDRKNTRLNSSH